jgi:hypothetical protein
MISPALHQLSVCPFDFLPLCCAKVGASAVHALRNFGRRLADRGSNILRRNSSLRKPAFLCLPWDLGMASPCVGCVCVNGGAPCKPNLATFVVPQDRYLKQLLLLYLVIAYVPYRKQPPLLHNFSLANACVVCRCALRIGCSRTLVGMHTTSDGASPFSFRIENESRGSKLVAAEHDRSEHDQSEEASPASNLGPIRNCACHTTYNMAPRTMWRILRSSRCRHPAAGNLGNSVARTGGIYAPWTRLPSSTQAARSRAGATMKRKSAQP